MRVDTAACLGKVPTHGDFVRHRASTPTMRALDQWIRKGLHHARSHRPTQWEAVYDAAPPRRFLLWRQGAQVPSVLLGVMAPSRDERDRTYPFIVTCEVPKHALRPQHSAYLPVRAETFYRDATALAQEATDGQIPHTDIVERVDQLDVELTVEPSVPHRHKRYLQQETMGPFLEGLFGHFEDSGKYRLFHALLQALLPLQGRPKPRLDYGLQFPLPSDGDVLSNVVSFWMGTVLRVLNFPSAAPSIFWTNGNAPASTADLLLYVGTPEARAFFDVLAPTRVEAVCQLGQSRDETNAEAALGIPAEYGQLLEREQIRLWDFLRRL